MSRPPVPRRRGPPWPEAPAVQRSCSGAGRAVRLAAGSGAHAACVPPVTCHRQERGRGAPRRSRLGNRRRWMAPDETAEPGWLLSALCCQHNNGGPCSPLEPLRTPQLDDRCPVLPSDLLCAPLVSSQPTATAASRCGPPHLAPMPVALMPPAISDAFVRRDRCLAYGREFALL